MTDASIDMGAAFEAGIKENFPNAEITFDKFHVMELANEAVDQVRREEARNNFQIRPALHLPEERRSSDAGGKGGALSVGSAEPRHDPSDAYSHEPATAVHDQRQSARRFLDRWNAWVQVCDLAPMKKLAKTIMAKSEGILRSIATGLSNGVLEAINGNVQAAKRKAKGYRTKRNLKAIVYLIAGDVLASSPI